MFETIKSTEQGRRAKDMRGNERRGLSYQYSSNASYEEFKGYRNGHKLSYDDLCIKYVGGSTVPAVQMYVRQENTFDGNEILWDSEEEKCEFWETVDNGLEKAKEQLAKVGARQDFLGQYANDVLEILDSPNLEIFPMIDDGMYGKSAFGIPQISLEVNKHKRKTDETAKTLIHEAFHIYGGCWKVNRTSEAPELIYNSQLDTACDIEDKNLIYKELKGKDKLNVRADAFAQYVMLS